MEYGDGRVWRRGNTWHIAWHEHGDEKRESAHTTDELVARALLREKVEAARTGQRILSSKELTVERLCLEVIGKFKRKHQNIEDAESNTRIWTRALGATTSLHKVPDRVKALILDWQEAEEDELGRPLDDGYTDATINRRLAFLQTGARELKFLPLWDICTKHKIAEDNVRDAYMNPEEFARLYRAAFSRDPDLADYLEWLYLTGTRRGEAALLEARWVDTHRWVLTIPGRVQKHRKARPVHLEGPMRRLVQQRLTRVQPQVPWLFHRDGVPLREIRHLWPALSAEAGLCERDAGGALVPRFRPHDLRRSAVTNLLDYLSPKQAMQITGHLTLSTFTRYQQVPEDQLRARLRSIPEPAWTATPSPASHAA
jgi:integrase